MAHNSNNPSLRVAFKTFGCRSNQADTAELQALLAGRGARLSGSASSADVIVVNTCTVTDEADSEALQFLRKLRAEREDLRIVVTGCMAETGSEKVLAAVPDSAVVGPGRKADVVEAIFRSFTGLDQRPNSPQGERKRSSRLPVWQAEDIDLPLPESTPAPAALFGGEEADVRSRSRYHLRIQEGCENSCTFCIIPASRGNLVSRSADRIVEDILRLEELGYEEIVLTGTHIGGYGLDNGSSLEELLSALCAAPRRARLRLSSIDPNDVTPGILDILASGHVFCPHLHICTQSLSDGILKRMNRRYRVADVVRLMYSIGKTIPFCAIGTDLITGFPGERREDVEQGIERFLDLPFSYLHVFPYSERQGTAATRLPGSVAAAERKRRAARWRAIGEKKHRAYLESLIGRPIEFICEHRRDGELGGTSAEFAAVRCLPGREEIRAGEALPYGKRITATVVGVDRERGELLCR